jgi:hypothetical protein
VPIAVPTSALKTAISRGCSIPAAPISSSVAVEPGDIVATVDCVYVIEDMLVG